MTHPDQPTPPIADSPEVVERGPRVLITPETVLPRTYGTIDLPFDDGDVLKISCPPATAHVEGFGTDTVHLTWPWTAAGAEPTARAVPFDPSDPARTGELWRYDPAPSPDLKVGDSITISIPDTVVHVAWAGDAPGDRSQPHAGVLRYGVQDTDAVRRDNKLISLYLDGPEPLTIELVHRPYPFLQDHDEVTDPAGRVWSFFKPVGWYEHGGALRPTGPTRATEGPAWPLRLTGRPSSFEPTEAEAAAVWAATVAGSHADELAAWQHASGTTPAEIDYDDHEPHLSPAVRAAEAARVRANLRGRTLVELQADVDLARHWHHTVAKVVLTEEDELHEEYTALKLEETERVLAHVTATGAAAYDGTDF